MEKVHEKFLRYISYDTTSDEKSENTPSTSSQTAFAHMLAKELNDIGAKDVSVSSYGYVTAVIPASKGYEAAPALGFIAHMDTTSEMSGANIKPCIIDNYNGEDIVLNKCKDIVMKSGDYTQLSDYVGDTLIVTDGTTLLGADDKAGIAEIITAAEIMLNENKLPHGKICIGFTPDEEIGRGADHFDVKGFGAEFAYTVDGGAFGEIEYENFNAFSVNVTINGINIHPGTAKNSMVNSILLANEFTAMLDNCKTPQHTEGYEGFWHLNGINGSVEKTQMTFILRDHSYDKLNELYSSFEAICDYLNKKYGKDTVKITKKESYRNMKDIITENYHLIENACKALEIMNEKPNIIPIRGGTDGARLSFMGLPCPNLGTGGNNFHGRYEFISVQSMEKTVEQLVTIASLYAE